MNTVDIAELRKQVAYDPVTGALSWITSKRGRPAGPITNMSASGYIELMFMGVRLRGHRVAWALHYGYWPEQMLDHIDGNRANNAISNLRLTDYTENAQNRRTSHKRRASGNSGLPLGVTREAGRRKFIAQICTRGKRQYLGSFDTPELAHMAYLEAKRQLHASNTL